MSASARFAERLLAQSPVGRGGPSTASGPSTTGDSVGIGAAIPRGASGPPPRESRQAHGRGPGGQGSTSSRDQDGAAGALRRAALQEWEAIIASLREPYPPLAAILEHGVPRMVTHQRIVVSFQRGSFYGRQAENPDTKALVAAAAERRLGGRPEIEIRFDADGSVSSRTVAAVEAKRREARLEQQRREALNHPAVLDALQVFPEAVDHVQVRIQGE